VPYVENISNGDNAGESSLEEQVDVLLVLALSQESATGDCPSMEQIVAWHEHRLIGRPGAEVESHVARCQHCYGIWSGLLDAAGVDNEPRPQDRRDPRRQRCWSWTRWYSRRRAGLVSGGLIAAGIVALLVSLNFGPERSQWPHIANIEQGYLTIVETGLAAAIEEKWTWGSGLGIKSPDVVGGNNKKESWERQLAQRAFRYGVRVGLQRMVGADGFWRGAVQALPSSTESCSGSMEEEACESINRAFYELGRWGVLVHFACDVSTSFGTSTRVSEQLSPEFWTLQVDLMAELDQLIQLTLSDSSFARFFTEWRREAEEPIQPRTALCSREAALLTLGLR